MRSKIILEDIKIFAYHGVLEEEKTLGTYYLIQLEAEADLWKASETDELSDTINYAEINDIIHQEMTIPSELLEHVAGRIIKKIHQHFPSISSLKIKITKTNPPMKGEMKGVSVAFEQNW
ncbi:MAG: dihydroneopterin aldolase [Bacteroidetes bacterium]|nr:dihydroneopterin aldolase [Bacteroidota bacterium]